MRIKDISPDSRTLREFGQEIYKWHEGLSVSVTLPDDRVVNSDEPLALVITSEFTIKSVLIGSIVEGSEVEVGPYEATTPQEYTVLLERVKKETDFYWNRDNLEGPEFKEYFGVDESEADTLFWEG